MDSKFLWWFTGEDPYVLGQCSRKLRRKFGLIGILVIFISLISAGSLAYGVEQILQSVTLDIVIGIYFGCFILILYLFLLHTLSRNVLPTDPALWSGRLISICIRILFLIFLGFLVAQPINYFVFKGMIDNELVEFKNKEILDLNQRLNLRYARELNAKKSELISSVLMIKEIEKNNRKKNRELRAFMASQAERNFFVRKVIIQNSLPPSNTDSNLKGNLPLVLSCWGLGLVFILIFIAPVFLKRYISISSEYYNIKRAIETKLVNDHFNRFVETYNEFYNRNYPELGIAYTSRFIDPPYNTRLKSTPKSKHQSDFLKWLFNESS